jgi:hypothetical protein
VNSFSQRAVATMASPGDPARPMAIHEQIARYRAIARQSAAAHQAAAAAPSQLVAVHAHIAMYRERARQALKPVQPVLAVARMQDRPGLRAMACTVASAQPGVANPPVSKGARPVAANQPVERALAPVAANRPVARRAYPVAAAVEVAPPIERALASDDHPDDAPVGQRRPRQEARAEARANGGQGRRYAATAHARSFNYDWELGLLGEDGKRRSYGVCSDPLALYAACDATLEAIPPVSGAEAKRRAAVGGYALDNPLRLAAQAHRAVIQLVKVLPIATVLKAAGFQGDTADTVDAGRVLGFLLRKVQSRWRYSTIDNARRAWERFELWLRDEGVPHENGDVTSLVLNEYLLQVHNECVQRSDREWEAKVGHWEDRRAAALARNEPPPPEPQRTRFGEKGALGQYDGLAFLAENFGMGMPTRGCRRELPSMSGHRARHMPAPAPPFPLWVVARIERYALAADTPPAMRNAAAATLFLVYGCCRAEQAQNMQVYGIAHDCVWGQVNIEKGKTKRPRPFWAALRGFYGRGWWDVLVQSLEGVLDGGFVFREYTGNPLSFEAKADAACLAEDAITPRIRLMLQQSCGMSRDEAAAYTKHSGRHCLPASSAARGEGFQRQVEVGRWAGGTFDTSDLFGDDFLRAKQAMQVSAMPIRYTARLRPRRLAEIMAQQTAAFRALLAECDHDVEKLPREKEGYGRLPKYDPAREGL